MPDWRLRASRPDDIEAMYEVWHAAVQATHHFLSASDFAAICLQVRRDYLRSGDFIVAVDGGDRVIGFMRMEGTEIDSLYIAPAFHRQGLGQRFVAEAASGIEILEVEVNAQNTQAVAFYDAMGFREIASKQADHEGRPYPLLRMRREMPHDPP